MCESVLSMYPKCVDITKRIHFHSSHLITVFEFARKWFNYRDYYTYIVLNGTVCTSKFAKGGVVVAFANWWYFLDILLLLLSLHRFRLTIFDCVILYGCWRELLFYQFSKWRIYTKLNRFTWIKVFKYQTKPYHFRKKNNVKEKVFFLKKSGSLLADVFLLNKF